MYGGKVEDKLGVIESEARSLREQVENLTRQAGNSSASTINVNGGGWINSLSLVVIGALALTMFILFLSDRVSAGKEREDFKAQARQDIQRIDNTLNRHAEKLETHDAYINDMFRRMKDK